MPVGQPLPLEGAEGTKSTATHGRGLVHIFDCRADGAGALWTLLTVTDHLCTPCMPVTLEGLHGWHSMAGFCSRNHIVNKGSFFFKNCSVCVRASLRVCVCARVPVCVCA